MKIILIFLQIYNENYDLSELSLITSLAKSISVDYSIYLREKNQINQDKDNQDKDNQDKDNKDTDEIISHISGMDIYFMKQQQRSILVLPEMTMYFYGL